MYSTSSLADPQKSGQSTVPAAGPLALHASAARPRRVALSEVDVAAQLTAGKDLDAIDEAEARRVLRKIDRPILPLMCCS